MKRMFGENVVYKLVILFFMSCMSAFIIAGESAAVARKPFEYKEPTYDPKGLLIFLDDSEKDLGAISIGFLTAISQQAGPILVSGSLVYNTLIDVDRSLVGTDKENLVKLFKDMLCDKGLTKVENNGKCKFVALEALAFDSKKWIIKKINDFLYLFIPHAYLTSSEHSTVAAVEAFAPGSISKIELQLGLKVNHMETIRDIGLIRPVEKPRYAHYFVEALYGTATGKSTIFCTRSDYYENKVTLMPVWTFYMFGHGMIGGRIVALSLEDFKKVLDFFEHSITTRLLMYFSCYAAGLNTELIYKDIKTAVQKTYSFAIITEALTDASTSISRLKLSMARDGRSLQLIAAQNFQGFFAKMTDKMTLADGINYQEVSDYVFEAPTNPLKGGYLQWQDQPQIKLPGLEWFSVLASNKNIVSIGSILAKTRDPQKPLNMAMFYKTEKGSLWPAKPKALLLYAQDIPFEIIFNSDLNVVISMLPGEAIHKIKKITVPDFYRSPESTLAAEMCVDFFMKIRDLGVQKLFYIEQLNEASNVIIDCKRSCTAYFYKDGKLYVKSGPGAVVHEADASEKDQYEKLMQGVTSTIVLKKGYGDFGSIVEIERVVSKCQSICVIEKIEAVKWILWPFINSMFYRIDLDSGKNFFWIHQLIVKNGIKEGRLSFVSEFPADAVMMLKDVIIQSFSEREGLFYFTIGESFYKGKAIKNIDKVFNSVDYKSPIVEKIDKDYRDEYRALLSGAREGKPTREQIQQLGETLTRKRPEKAEQVARDIKSSAAPVAVSGKPVIPAAAAATSDLSEPAKKALRNFIEVVRTDMGLISKASSIDAKLAIGGYGDAWEEFKKVSVSLSQDLKDRIEILRKRFLTAMAHFIKGKPVEELDEVLADFGKLA